MIRSSCDVIWNPSLFHFALPSDPATLSSPHDHDHDHCQDPIKTAAIKKLWIAQKVRTLVHSEDTCIWPASIKPSIQLTCFSSLSDTPVVNGSHSQQLEQESLAQQEHEGEHEGATALTEPPTTTPSGAPMPTTTDPTLIETWDRCWAVVKATPTDFDAWEELMRLADRQDGGFGPEAPSANISNVRTIYNTFLNQFPLCFGYWKKYSDLEFMARGVEGAIEVQYAFSKKGEFFLPIILVAAKTCANFLKYQIDYIQIFERGVKSISNSVDLWVQYCSFVMDHNPDDRDAIER